MKIVIDIEDFYLDEEQNIEPALKSFLINQTVHQIEQSIKKKVEDQVQIEVKRVVEQTLYAKIQKETAEIVEREMVQSPEYPNKELIPLSQYIKLKFVNGSGWQSPNETIEKLAKQFGEELKRRYDIIFATQIVNKMKENNFLKEDIANLLLESEKQS